MPEMPAQVAASLIAAVLLLLRDLLPDWNGLPRTVAATLALAGAGKSQAYDMLDRLRALLPTLIGKPGRPRSLPSEQSATLAVVVTVRDYLADHAGALCGTTERRIYSDGFRRFIVGLTAPQQPAADMSAADLAYASGVPLGTLKTWLHPRQTDVDKPAAPSSRRPTDGSVITPPPAHAEVPASPDGSRPSEGHDIKTAAAHLDDLLSVDDADVHTVPVGADDVTSDKADESTSPVVRGPHLQHIATLWKFWQGPFKAFCKMLRTEERMPYRDTFIGNVLQSLGLRYRRLQRPIEAPWSSGTFRTLFPGAQWLGDGTDIGIRWGDERFVFNLEAVMDVACTAVMGLDVSESESEKALHHAYEEAKITSGGAPPLATTLDNKPCNHSPAAQAALHDTILLRATPGRGQAKAPLEGAFGLFQQDLPPLVVTGKTPQEMAASVLRLIACAYYRGRNGRPRRRLNGRTPIEAYANTKPTPQEVAEARHWLQELQRRQERARLTREARRDPVRIQLLMQGLAELRIPDSDQRLTISLAYYARDAIARGLATFRTKQELGTLPPGADHGRYLGGIIRQLHTRLELERISVHLLQQRLRLHDFTLAPLERDARQLRTEVTHAALPQAFVDRALDATYSVDFRFWAEAAAKALTALHTGQRNALYQALCRRIAANFDTERGRREDLLDRLAEAVAVAA